MRFFLTLLILLPAIAGAEVSAILIGVSDYDDQTGITDLQGPKNDIDLLRSVLTRRGVAQIDVLADGVEGAIRPTRAAILAQFAAKVETLEPGDFVYIHFSGHGTQQKDMNGDETDGLDEVFLPIDTARAEPGTGLIPNAITDDEIGAAIDRMRAKGADVWLVLDSCNSGSGLRAGGSDVVARYVDPAVLGVEGVAAFGLEDRLAISDLVADGAGGVIAFYAAQSSELAREIRIDTADGSGAYYGLFSSRLAARLDGGATQSFRQLFQSVLRDMNDISVPGAARMQTPLWDGDLIDAAVFGGASTSSLRRFEVRRDRFFAGQVHGFSDGSLIGLVEQAHDPADALIGYAQLELTDATSGFLRPVARDCDLDTATRCETSGVLPPEARFGQLVAKPVALSIRFSVPIAFSTGAALAADHPVRMALHRAVGETPAVSLSDTDFDVEVGWDGDALWFGPRTTLKGRPIGLSWHPSERPLTQVLAQIAQAEMLDRLLGSLTQSSSVLNPNPVRVVGVMSPVAAADLLAPDTTVSPQRECIHAQKQRDPTQLYDLGNAAQFKQCDGLRFHAQGLVAGARDVNRIHIDAKYCIHNTYARIEDTARAADLGPEMTLCSNCGDGYNAGDERLFIIVSEAAPNQSALNLTGLIENCAVQSATRSARAARVDGFLASLAQGRATRGNLGRIGLSNIWVERYRWTILPKDLALSGSLENETEKGE